MGNKNVILRLGTPVFVSIFCCGIVFAQTTLQPDKREFNVKQGGQLTIDSEFGTIDVQTAEQDKVTVITTKEVTGKLDSMAQAALADFEVTFEQENSDVKIEGTFKYRREYWLKKGHPLHIRFQVIVPYEYNVFLETRTRGNIHVGDIAGTVRAQTSDGDLRFGDIRGTVWAKTRVRGNITLENCQGDVTFETSTGDIHLGAVASAVEAKTRVRGNITLENCQGDVTFETSTGDIHLGAVAGTVEAKTRVRGNITLENCQGDVTFETSTGDIHLNIVAGVVKKAKTRVRGNIKLERCEKDAIVETSTGDIHLGAVAGTVEAKTRVRGNITLENCQGDVTFETSTGDMHLGIVAGAVKAKTRVRGNVTLKGCQKDVTVEISDGNIYAEIAVQPQYSWTLHTLKNISVTLSSNIAFDVDAKTRGRISSDFPVQVQGTIAENMLKGTLNGGGPLLKLRASSGQIRLKGRK